jgi:hypothetical protein
MDRASGALDAGILKGWGKKWTWVAYNIANVFHTLR